MKCPFCDKDTTSLKNEKKKRTYRKEDFEIFEYYFKCNNCGEEFTTTEIDTLNTIQVYNLYREKYSIPFPDQLTSIREHYNLSSAKMSALLGFGPNQYRLYESGELPAGGNSTVLRLIVDPTSFKGIVKKNKSEISSKKYAEIMSTIEAKINDNINKWLEHSLFPNDIIPNQYTGYLLPDFKKFAQMVLFFLANAQFKTRLNKLLFYADFTHYKYYGYSISGSQYAAIPLGPVPNNYDYKFSLLTSENIISTQLEKINNKEVDKISPETKFNKSIFSQTEMKILNLVLSKFEHKSTSEIIDISHNEVGWKNNLKRKELISYLDFAPQLIAL